MIYPSTQSKHLLPIINRAKDQYCYGIEGEKFLDFMGGNNTVILGHKQFKFKHCPSYSGRSYMEDKTSSLLSQYTNTDLFRYFKNGSDAVNCALRLSKHILRRDSVGKLIRVCFIGYAGSGDDYVRTINVNGISNSSCKSYQLKAKDIRDSRGEYILGADILVYESRYKHFADSIKADIKICDHLKSGILGLDEPTADFDLYGKSLANGYPIAVLTGRNDLMSKINDIYYSTTYGGENTGLEAIHHTLNEFEPIKENYLNLLSFAKETLKEWHETPLQSDEIQKFVKKSILYNGNWQLMTCHTKENIVKLKKEIDALM